MRRKDLLLRLSRSTWAAMIVVFTLSLGFVVGTSPAGASPSGGLPSGITVTPGAPFGPAPGASGAQPQIGTIYCKTTIINLEWQTQGCIQYISSSEIETEGWLEQGPSYTGHQELTTLPPGSIDMNYGQNASYVAGGAANEYNVTGPAGTFPVNDIFCVTVWRNAGGGTYENMVYVCDQAVP